MRTIFIDAENHCHVENDGSMIPYETAFFDEKCNTFVEGYCVEVMENGVSMYPWKPYDELESAQREYERQKLADAENALAILLGGAT